MQPCSLVLLVCLAALSPQGKRVVVTPDGTRGDLPFSPAIVSGDLVYVSGVVPSNRALDIEGQTRDAFARIEKTLSAAGTSLANAVRSNVYLTDSRHFASMNAVYAEQFGEAPPPRATVETDLAVPGALLEVTIVAAREGVARSPIQPEGWPKPTRPYSWGMRAGDTVFLSGMVSRDPVAGKLVLGDIGTQTRQVLKNIGALLEAAGLTKGDVVSSTVFLSDARDFAGMNEVYRTFFDGDDPPARATVRTRLMNPAMKVEIQCVAVRDGKRKAITAKDARRSSSPFSPSIVAGQRQFLAGMVGRGADGFARGIAAQTRQTLANLQATLEAAGAGFGDVVEVVVYLSDVRHFQAMNEVYRELLPNAPPVRTTVGAQLMSPDALVEIMMTAVR